VKKFYLTNKYKCKLATHMHFSIHAANAQLWCSTKFSFEQEKH